MLIPAYRPLVRRSEPVLNQVKTWPAGAVSALQDSFECTDWDMFREAATNGDSINSEEYMSSVTSYIRVHHRTLQPEAVDEGIQSITNYRPAPPTCDSDASLPDVLNSFYARFEAWNDVTVRKTIPSPEDQVLCLTTADIITVVPMVRKSPVSCLNDHCPVALAPIIMKCFKRPVMRHIKNLLPPSLDPMQFAYRPNRSTDDAITTTLHLSLTNLDNKDSYVRMLFIDFSSAFNTTIPQHLIEKLSLLGLNTSLCNWILDFLTGRPQSVRIGNSTSSTTTLSTGAPQGCVLSPLLFTLLTHDCAAMYSSNHILKFTDDTAVVGLISKNHESAYREEVQRLKAWCKDNNLSLNIDKTKEMVVDFRRAQSDHSPLNIHGSNMEIVIITISKKAQQRLYFLRSLRKAHLPPPILTMFYRGTIESVLSSCITA
ncbi:hypothetical protein QTP86_008245 [Hemibagrus guttatus]|nr:hypothetical protein QTP86_008245 [Hemibagrus guttatus]